MFCFVDIIKQNIWYLAKYLDTTATKDQQKITHNYLVRFVWCVFVFIDVCRTVCTRFLYGLYGVSDACDWHPCSITLALAVWSATRTSASISICRIATGCIHQHRAASMSHKRHQAIAYTSDQRIHRRGHQTSPQPQSSVLLHAWI